MPQGRVHLPLLPLPGQIGVRHCGYQELLRREEKLLWNELELQVWRQLQGRRVRVLGGSRSGRWEGPGVGMEREVMLEGFGVLSEVFRGVRPCIRLEEVSREQFNSWSKPTS